MLDLGDLGLRKLVKFLAGIIERTRREYLRPKTTVGVAIVEIEVKVTVSDALCQGLFLLLLMLLMLLLG